ncbi:hypothetical protein [Streptomyces sp. NRRL F-5053]|uniref:hypothetical protein n=1 Tax=Streptomyces sp. NRRL F-5053 TaxID=1463854 RepID=UPI00133159D3|nr:hypothetical protein [Streptomyces sp. NRRL F-5053]
MSSPQCTAHFIGGPLDGHTADVTDWTVDEIATGVLHVVDSWTERADYEPEPGGDPLRWLYRGLHP